LTRDRPFPGEITVRIPRGPKITRTLKERTQQSKWTATPAGDLHGQRDHKGTPLRNLIHVGDVLEPGNIGAIDDHMGLEA
jgi:hypothetical protein